MMFNMNPLHEGDRSGDIDIKRAAASIKEQLQLAQLGATWSILGWQSNPRQELLAGIKYKKHVLILDGLSDRYAYQNRDAEWDGMPYTFRCIWNFGGRTTIGANVAVWSERYFNQLAAPRSCMNGIAVMPDASCNNPSAFAFFTGMAWLPRRPDLQSWFAQWAGYRYGGIDENSTQAWNILRTTAYSMPSGQWREAHDNLFSAQPNLNAKSACSWSSQQPRYNLETFSSAIGYFLQTKHSLRASTVYRYDWVDLARQTFANQSRILLPKISAAYGAMNTQKFHDLIPQWLTKITILNRITGADASFLLEPWIGASKVAGQSTEEQRQLEFDACSLLRELDPEPARGSGLHDYANRGWNGLLEFYHEHWAIYFSNLEQSLGRNTQEKAIDWFTFDQKYAKQKNNYSIHPGGYAYEIMHEVLPEIMPPME